LQHWEDMAIQDGHPPQYKLRLLTLACKMLTNSGMKCNKKGEKWIVPLSTTTTERQLEEILAHQKEHERREEKAARKAYAKAR
jgi:hypothetical protein